jgi:hypothetical protein
MFIWEVKALFSSHMTYMFIGPDVQYCRVLFWPNLEEAMSRDIHAGGGEKINLEFPLNIDPVYSDQHNRISYCNWF